MKLLRLSISIILKIHCKKGWLSAPHGRESETEPICEGIPLKGLAFFYKNYALITAHVRRYI
jgi:hypothetical protein